jgi:uncharacterized protein
MPVAAADSASPPAPTRWATDTVGFLSARTRQQLDQRLEAYQARTGHQVIVWIGDSIGAGDLETWAARTFVAWGIGRGKGHDDGAALFILAQDRRMRIEVGYGLEGQLTDLEAASILRDELTPRLRQGDRDAAVIAAVNRMLAALGGEAPGAAPAVSPLGDRDGADPRPIPRWQLYGMGILGVLFLLFLITHPRMAAALLYTMAAQGGRRGGGYSGGGGFGGGGGGGFSGGGGRSGGGGASGSW